MPRDPDLHSDGRSVDCGQRNLECEKKRYPCCSSTTLVGDMGGNKYGGYSTPVDYVASARLNAEGRDLLFQVGGNLVDERI